MNKLLQVLIFLLAAAGLCAWEIDTEHAVPGGLILVDGSAVELLEEGKIAAGSRTLSSGEVFSVGSRRVILLPIPCDAEPAGVTVLVRRDGIGWESCPATLGEREFIFEEIPLNGSMSDLRQSDSPRKAEESRSMWQLLGRFDELAPLSGPFLLPVGRARESSHFGDRRLFRYSDGSHSRSLHLGIDYAVPVGTPVWAPADGKVVLATERMLTGFSVVLEHGPGIYTIYYHLDSIAAGEGDTVRQGEVFAESGVSGLATGAHLHWELRINRVPVDPLLFTGRPFFVGN